MDARLNLGSEVRDLKFGSTFTTTNPRTSFHTLKYDFKPASVDPTKSATVDVAANNQVTVTVPHLDSSGVPKTVFKGNQRNYTKECVLIIDKVTGDITLERLHHNIQVKKTRSENVKSVNVAVPPVIRASLENSTQRTVSKTKVSTGVRKNTLSGLVQRHSPLQSSPSYPHHKSPQQAPAWNANNNMSTLPSIPMIGMDDDIMPMAAIATTTTGTTNVSESNSYYQNTSSNNVQQLQQHSPHLLNNNIHSINNNNNNEDMNNNNSSNSNSNHINGHHNHHHRHHHHNNQQQQQQQQPSQQNGLGVLSSSDSSSGSESSGSDSDIDEKPSSIKLNNHNTIGNGSTIPPNLFLHEDLHLSESNSSDTDN